MCACTEWLSDTDTSPMASRPWDFVVDGDVGTVGSWLDIEWLQLRFHDHDGVSPPEYLR